MGRVVVRCLALVLCVVLLSGMLGCQTPAVQNVNMEALFGTLRQQVQFETTLESAGEDSAFYFPDFPAGTTVRLYIGSGYYADELAWITVPTEKDVKAAKDCLNVHLEQRKSAFEDYIPVEVAKIQKAIIWTWQNHLILCVGNDAATAKAILDKPADPTYTVPATTVATEPTTVVTEPATVVTEPTTVVTVPPTEPVQTEPALQSQGGTFRVKNGVIVVDNAAYETFAYEQASAQRYAEVINKAATALGPDVTVYDLLIPTAVGITLPDDIVAQYSDYVNQGETIQTIFAMMSEDIVKVNCFDTLRLHRDEYLYFRTDFHWNGPAAYYAYESFCQAKGITPYTMEQRPCMEFEGFLGALYYNNTDKDPKLRETPDTVIAYDTKSRGVSMYYFDKEGNRISWPVINDVSDWAASAKYNTFAGSDQPLAVFTNPEVTDGSACVVIKESFGNALMSYIVDHYSTVYEIDYRYWSGDLVSFVRENGVTDVIFANNLSMTRNMAQVGMLNYLF